MDKTIIKPFEEIEYKIYGYTLPEIPTHDGYVKIGDTTRDAATRVFEQVGTAGLNPDILFEKLARKSDGRWFRDKEFHRFLLLNGIERKDFNSRADEWFYFNGMLEKAEELTDKFINRDYEEIQITDDKFDYVLRNEQQQAVEKTLEYYHSDHKEKEFLWNAKPRFGKTLTTYDFIRNLKTKNVLIVTNRPAIANSWFDDFKKFIAWQEPHMKFVSETEAISGKAMTRPQYREYLDTTTNPSQITFISLQDLKGAKFAGGRHEKLEWVAGLDWDVLVIDEAHEGIDTKKTDRAFSQIKRKFTLHLSGTPFKALANNKFHEEQIFNWSYVDEQEAKEDWDPTIGSNPYENLPTLNLFTYQMSKMIEDEVTAGLQIENETNIDYAFDLNEFFRVKENGQFEYEDSVIRFLDNLSSGKFPFSENQYRNELNHTFWLLPRVKAAKALEKLLKSHPRFKEYEVVLAAGDGVSIQDDLEAEALDVKKNIKSFDKVREAIQKHDKTITLSVGQLTTGVTIPEWTAVFMLNNIESPSLYFQAAFRSQNPYEFEQKGKLYRKENAYIFDFSPDRTLRLYDEFANNLTGGSSKTSSERKSKIKKLLNFFPVIAEDEDGSMHEINASEVLTIPTRITSREVVKRGFMSNLLFANIAGIFSGDSPFKEILDKIPPEKNKRLEKPREVEVPDTHLDEEGEVDIPKEVVVGTSKDIFGDKIYAPIDVVEEVAKSIDEAEEKQKESIKTLAGDITKSFANGFDKLKDNFKLNKGQTEDITKTVHTTLEDMITDKHLAMTNQVKEVEREYEQKKEDAEQENNEEALKIVTEQYEEKKKEIETAFTEEINNEVEETIHTVVEEQIEKVEEKKKKTTEDDVRDHLRGFARTIPAFLMAYGDDETTLSNFDENIDEATFEDLTSITIDEFKKLRDGFEYVDDSGSEKSIPGLFNEVVFNASIREFLDTKERLANYFDESLEEDIFDYIPPQKTNQIFTPRQVVKMMVDALEKENPNIFKDKTKKFADLYVKSGLYITEIVKKLNEGLKYEIPNEQERIKWILENQVYACTPSNIIYNISKEFIFGNLVDISSKNLIEFDTMKLVSQAEAIKEIYKLYGDDTLKFDVIIGNPPYQEEDGGAQSSARPIYHHFIQAAKSLKPQYITYITPSRWFAGGRGLDSFRNEMLNDLHLKEIHDWLTPEDIFPNTNIRGGVNFFLWASDYNDSNIRFASYKNGKKISDLERPLAIDGIDILLRDNIGIKVLEKIYANDYMNACTVSELVSPLRPFGFRGYFIDDERYNSTPDNLKKPIICYARGWKKGYVERDIVEIRPEWIDQWKLFTPRANNIGTELSDDNFNIRIGEPGTICTESYMVIGAEEELGQQEIEALGKYLQTKFSRFLHSLAKGSQDATTKTYRFIPMQDFTSNSDISWDNSIVEIDEQLYKKYKLTPSEVEYIKSNIKKMT
ncbi:Eco57I restriction-modification methylase domain-containing protein [Virgibacillus sp. W0181]|uniref:Eco57I restriction-modification methylase domain-containing protein n=1 Tax=Virgibacillus sp. W0181 TaxID=3391581 RepID=UPI003F461A47